SLTCFFFFFFQAEDGIRDGHVTGVQTCALPISEGPAPLVERSRPTRVSRQGGETVRIGICLVSTDWVWAWHEYDLVGLVGHTVRSEERRVGKECRWRGWADE